MPPQSRIVMLVDLDYFFAQCEELRNPSLKNKPVVVGVYSGRTADSGAVSTSNYVARKYSVKSGIPLFLAKKRLEGTEAVFLPVDYEYYQGISDRIMQILRGYADAFEQVGIDEAYLDVTQKAHENFEETKTLVQEIKSTVKREVGVSFSVGVGPNKLVAKIGSNIHKPDGVTIVKPEEVEVFLLPLSVDSLLGVGKKTTVKMETLGIKTIGDLAKCNAQKLVEVFGKSLGVYFHNAANGVDNEPVRETGEAESINRIATLKANTRDLKLFLEKTDQLSEEIHKELTQKGLSFKQVSILAVLTDLSTKSRSVTLEKPAKDLETIRRNVRELFDKFLAESEFEVRRVGVKVSHFGKEEREQQQLTSFFGS
ncbi:MAG TPA: DNA polymerase IV [Candidatus Bathyarchaeia archaeon]|nr:DNA polymerase IV [Candidatus Bathyarchaeia archaeon]